MLLSKKETPDQFTGMWWAGLLNLVVSMINVAIYTQNDSIVTLICACVSAVGGVVIFVIIKRKTHAIIWNKLSGAKCQNVQHMTQQLS